MNQKIANISQAQLALLGDFKHFGEVPERAQEARDIYIHPEPILARGEYKYRKQDVPQKLLRQT